MGLISKIKNVLFEEEEVEIPVFKKEEKQTEEIKPIRRIAENIVKDSPAHKDLEKKEIPIEKEDNERETFKIEPTFQFPVFDEKEFEKPKKISVNKEKKNNKKSDFGKYEQKKSEVKEEKKRFTPSPIISPVYGIRDKNFNIQDFAQKKKNKKKVIDVDSVRKKAYGNLEDEIEKTLDKNINEFYEEKPTKSINELLIDTVDEEIPVDIDFDKDDDTKEEQLLNEDLTLDVLDEKRTTNNIDDTLENDLFNLIDSMYTNGEDES